MIRNAEVADIFSHCANHKKLSKELLLEMQWLLLPLPQEEPPLPLNYKALEKMLQLILEPDTSALRIQRLAIDLKSLLSTARRFKRGYKYEAKRQGRTLQDLLARHDRRLAVLMASIVEMVEDTESRG